MGFIEKLKQRLEAEAQARQLREESLRFAKQTEETARIQRESKEAEIHTQRRKQAEAFEQESGIGVLLEELRRLVSMDNSKQWPKGRQRISPPMSWDDYVYRNAYEYDSGIAQTYHEGTNQLGSTIKLFDTDSIYDVIRWDDGEEKVVKDYSTHERVNRIVHHSRKYIGVETSPDGDIVFHFKTRKSVPRSAWKDNREILESALGEAYGRPGTYVVEEQQWTHGPITGMS